MSLELTFYITDSNNVSKPIQSIIIGIIHQKDIEYFQQRIVQKTYSPFFPLKLFTPKTDLLDQFISNFTQITTFMDDNLYFPAFLALPDSIHSYLDDPQPNMQNFITFTPKIVPISPLNTCQCGKKLPLFDAENIVFDEEIGSFKCSCGQKHEICAFCGPQRRQKHCEACETCHFPFNFDYFSCQNSDLNCVFCNEQFENTNIYRVMGCGCRSHYSCFDMFQGLCCRCNRGQTSPIKTYQHRQELVKTWRESDVSFSIFSNDINFYQLTCRICKHEFFDFSNQFCHKCFGQNLKAGLHYTLQSHKFIEFIDQNTLPIARPDELCVYVYFHQFYAADSELFDLKLAQIREYVPNKIYAPKLAEMLEQQQQLQEIATQNLLKSSIQNEEFQLKNAEFEQKQAQEQAAEDEKIFQQVKKNQEIIDKIFTPKLKKMHQKLKEDPEYEFNSEENDEDDDFSSEINYDEIESSSEEIDEDLEAYLKSNPAPEMPEYDPNFVFDPKMFQLEEEEEEIRFPDAYLTEVEKAKKKASESFNQWGREEKQQNVQLTKEQQALLIAAILSGNK